MSAWKTLLIAGCLLAWITAPNANASTVSSGMFSDAPLGFVVCTVTTDGTGIFYCFQAHRISEGQDAGKVEVVSVRHQGLFSWGRSFLADDSAMTSFEENGFPAVRLVADIPDLGVVDVVSSTDMGGAIQGDNATCFEPLEYVLRAKEPVIFGAHDVRGTVDDSPVTNLNVCGSHFVGQTDGMWWAVTAQNAAL